MADLDENHELDQLVEEHSDCSNGDRDETEVMTEAEVQQARSTISWIGRTSSAIRGQALQAMPSPTDFRRTDDTLGDCFRWVRTLCSSFLVLLAVFGTPIAAIIGGRELKNMAVCQW